MKLLDLLYRTSTVFLSNIFICLYGGIYMYYMGLRHELYCICMIHANRGHHHKPSQVSRSILDWNITREIHELILALNSHNPELLTAIRIYHHDHIAYWFACELDSRLDSDNVLNWLKYFLIEPMVTRGSIDAVFLIIPRDKFQPTLWPIMSCALSG